MTNLTTSQLAVIVFALHVFADFNLQLGAKLDKFKQSEWWRDLIDSLCLPDKERVRFRRKYRFDFVAGILIHSFSWAIVTFLPLVILANTQADVWLVVVPNAICHAVIDHLKANKLSINLCTDQILHILQIGATLAVWPHF